MLLLIDAGNTNIKWALVDAQASVPAVWAAHGVIDHAGVKQLSQILRDAARGHMPSRAMISNVAGAELGAALDTALQVFFPKLKVEWFSAIAQRAGLKNAYRHPTQLGSDRFASAIAARALYPGQALIVATCGTATTIDAVNAEGVFLGGMILPGLKLMAQSLAKNTAQLPQVAESMAMQSPFADNTDQAIVSGCINAQVGAIERAFALLVNTSNASQTARCLIAGGAAPYLLPHLVIAHEHVENLVLTGLLAVAQSADSDFPSASC